MTRRAGIYFLKRLDPEVQARELFHRLVADAITRRASDIHISPTLQRGRTGVSVAGSDATNPEPIYKLRFRVDGNMIPHWDVSGKTGKALVRMLLTLTNKGGNQNFGQAHSGEVHFDNSLITEHAATLGIAPSDRRARELGKFSLRVEISPRASVDEPAAVLRLHKAAQIKSLDDIGFPKDLLDQYREAIATQGGIVLVTGPTGSGKTTTLYASLAALDDGSVKIITIEDPVESRLEGNIEQIQVNEAREFGFLAALRSILRQDPDIILVGEVRDQETVRTAIQAALTGHLVFATLHTNDALGALPRLLDFGVSSAQLRDSLRGVIAQRLVPKLCDECAQDDNIEADFCDALGDLGRELSSTYGLHGARKAPGPEDTITVCSCCDGVGFVGRLVVPELWRIEGKTKDLLADRNADLERIRQQASTDGMIPMSVRALEMVLRGQTSWSEARKGVMRYADLRDNVNHVRHLFETLAAEGKLGFDEAA